MQLHQTVDKLWAEVEHLDRLFSHEDDDLSPAEIEVALSVAKRVRNQSTLLVRALAQERDNATDLEVTST